MPSKSKRQHNLMELVAHNPSKAKQLGIPQSVGREFEQADKGRKFKGGGMAHEEKGEMKKDIAQDKKLIKKAFGMHDKQEHKGEHTDLSKLKKGGMAMKEKMGPSTMSMDVEKGSNKLTKFGESAVQKRGKTKGTNLGDTGPSMGMMGGAGMKAGGMCGGGKTMKKMSSGGSASSRADGIASKGKTKGRIC
jgi:hypothetical protein